MRALRIAIVAAMSLVATSAWAVKPVLDAEKHVAVVAVGIQSAEENAKALFTMADRSETFGANHATLLFKNLGDALDQAQAHLNHLPPLAVGGYSDARVPLSTAKSYLQDAKNIVSQIQGVGQSSGLTPERVRSAVKFIYRDLEAARKSFEKSAHDFGLSPSFMTPG